jgi:hypothetical protein
VPDAIGLTSLPVANVARVGGLPTEQIGDPALTVLLSWARAVLTADIGAAWADLSPNETIVRTTSPHDPREEDFATQYIPHLFAYREDGAPRQNEDEAWGDETPITLLWVYPPASPDKQTARRGMQNAIRRSLLRAVNLWNARHPSWVVVGDTDPFAAQYGSSLLTHGGFTTLTVGMVRNAEVQVRDGKFDAISVELLAREDLITTHSFTGNLMSAVINQTASDGSVGFVQQVGLGSPPLSGFTFEFDDGFL